MLILPAALPAPADTPDSPPVSVLSVFKLFRLIDRGLVRFFRKAARCRDCVAHARAGVKRIDAALSHGSADIDADGSRLFLRGQRLRVCRIKNALRLLCCRIALIAVGPAAASGEHKDRE